VQADRADAASASGATATREMPTFLAAKRAPPPPGNPQVARTERKAAAPVKPAAKPANKQPARLAASAKPAPLKAAAAKPAGRGGAKAGTGAAADRTGLAAGRATCAAPRTVYP